MKANRIVLLSLLMLSILVSGCGTSTLISSETYESRIGETFEEIQELEAVYKFPVMVSEDCEHWEVKEDVIDRRHDPEKIGFMGFSAGGHLTLMTSTTSQTPAYEPVDELDEVPCHVNFAVPVYPAYVLQDGANGENRGKGNDSEFVADFAFDAKTPPMCLIHGDGDGYSPMGSVTVYHKLRTMNIPAELHVFALANHAFRNCRPEDPMMFWKDRVYAWMKVMQLTD